MIEGISAIRRLPRLGIIRLGEKATASSGKEYPKKLDYFNLKDAPGVAEVFGDKPKVLEIMLPHEDSNVFFPQWRKAYGKTTGLFCKGDGLKASRTRLGAIDGKNGLPSDPDGEAFIKAQGLKVKVGERFELPCLGAECPFTQKSVCRPIAQFMFLMPRVPGVGVYQISTTSFNSMVGLNSYVDIVRGIAGRVSMIPLRLSLVPKKVTVDGKAVGIFHLKLEYDGLMGDLIKYRNEKYLSADLLPQIEHEVPEDLVPSQGAKLDEVLAGGPPEIEGPEDAEVLGHAEFVVGDKFLVKRGDVIVLCGPGSDQKYVIAENMAMAAKKVLKPGDTVRVQFSTTESGRQVVELDRVPNPQSAEAF